MTRDDLQREAVETLVNDKKLILQWATGIGKSKVAIDTINRLKPKKTLLVVAETAHKDNWRKEFVKFGVEDLFNSVTVECYASLKNYRNTAWDFIVFDEAHHLGSDLRTDIFQTLKAERVLALSATISNASLVNSLEFTFGKFIVSKVNLQTAIDNGFIPEPKIILIPLSLDYLNRNQVIIDEWGRKEKRIHIKCKYSERWNYIKYKKTTYPNVTLEIECTEYEKYNYLCSQYDYWQKRYFSTRNEAVHNKWMMAGLKRKQFLGGLKTEKARELIETLKDTKFICFCASVEQAVSLGGENAIFYANKDNSDVISSFNTGDRKSLYAVGMLQEGQNLNGIEAGIIIQLDGKDRSFIQRFGKLVLPVCI